MRLAPTTENMHRNALQLLIKMMSECYMTLGRNGFDNEDGFDFWCAMSE